MMARLFRAAAVVVAVASLTACKDSSDESPPREVALADLACATLDPTTGVWESAPFPAFEKCSELDAGPSVCCPWIELPSKTSLRIEHPLGRIPRVVDPWISFSQFGVGSTVGSGDAVRLQTADDTYVVLQNNTDQRFYLRVDLR